MEEPASPSPMPLSLHPKQLMPGRGQLFHLPRHPRFPFLWHVPRLLGSLTSALPSSNLPFQKLSVVDQEKVDKFMIELDGTENKCE